MHTVLVIFLCQLNTSWHILFLEEGPSIEQTSPTPCPSLSYGQVCGTFSGLISDVCWAIMVDVWYHSWVIGPGWYKKTGWMRQGEQTSKKNSPHGLCISYWLQNSILTCMHKEQQAVRWNKAFPPPSCFWSLTTAIEAITEIYTQKLFSLVTLEPSSRQDPTYSAKLICSDFFSISVQHSFLLMLY